MIVGSIIGLEEVGKLDTNRLDEVTQAVLDEIRTNPIIDEQIRQNPVIMRELNTTVTQVLRGEKRPPAEHPHSLQSKR